MPFFYLFKIVNFTHILICLLINEIKHILFYFF